MSAAAAGERASGEAVDTGDRARRLPKRTQRQGEAARGPARTGRGEPVRAIGGGGGSSDAAAARMLTGRLWVPLLLALGVGSGSGGGDSGRRRLLAAKGGCWGTFFVFEEESRAGLRV